MLRIFIIILLSANLLHNYAQEVIATQGNSSSNSACSLDYTIGEVVITFGSDNITHLTQGFHQPVFEITTIQDLIIDFEVNIYPNPATNLLNIKFKNFQQGYCMELYDVSGKLLLKEFINKKETIIPFQFYSTGVYLLVFSNVEKELLKTFKIQKSH